MKIGGKAMIKTLDEWSELYVLLKLLAEGKLYAADKNANKIPSFYYNVFKILRSEKNSNLEYSRETEIKVINAETRELICCGADRQAACGYEVEKGHGWGF